MWLIMLPISRTITCPNVTRDLLMSALSFNLPPTVRVGSTFSLPARSTRWILLTISRKCFTLARFKHQRYVQALCFTWVNIMVKMAWERLLKSFTPLLAVVRLALPRMIRPSTSL
uniref:Uncharacterized protein n=1 Tax=Oreochromis aureus TaxID=47969 RepID=A0A668S5V1_OREAU